VKVQIDLGTQEEEISLLYQNLANLLFFQLRSAFFSNRSQLLNRLLKAARIPFRFNVMTRMKNSIFYIVSGRLNGFSG
jgi:hypothetical protein